MKNIITLLVAFLIFNFGYGQIITFDFAGNVGDEPSVLSNINDPNLSASTITRGAGLTANNNANRFNAQSWALISIANAITGNNYMEFTIAPNTGFQFDITTIDINFQRSLTGTSAIALRSSIDGYGTNIDGEKAIVDNTNIQTFSFNVSQANSATAVTYRFYGYSEQTGGSGGFEGGGNDIIINGTVTSLGTCSSPTVTWDGTNWTPNVPDVNTPAIINATYLIGNSVNEISFSACSLTINSNPGAGPEFRLRVTNSNYVEVINDVTVNGELFVETQGAFVQNNNTANFTVNATTGTALVNKSTTTLISWLEYTYWSSPTNDDTVENVFGNVPSNRRFLFNATNFIDMLEEVGNTGTFLNNPGVDDIDDDGNDWQIASGIMTPGNGYAATGSQLGFFPASQQFTFTGAFNNGIIQPAIVNNSGGLYNDWNFIGNPYPGAIDANVFFSVNSGIVDDAIYLWNQATPLNANASGNEGSNFSNADYAIITGSGVNTAGGDLSIIPNDYVPSGQGFFVEALTAGIVTFNNSMRVRGATDNSQFFRTTSNKNIIWINLTSDNGIANQLAVAYIDGATNANDGSYFDAKRNLSGGNAAIIYSTIDGDDGKFAIQGKDVNSLDIDEVISLGFKTNIEVATLYNFSIAQFEGDFFSNNTVYIKDNLLNVLYDLSLNDYTFTSEVGEFNNRFEIVFDEEALSLGNQTITLNDLSIIELRNGDVQFKLSGNLAMTSIKIIDLQGRVLYRLEAEGNNKTYNLSNLSQSVYIANVILSNGTTITKKAVKRF